MLKVGVIYGGNSPEYEFSIRSAETLIQNIDQAQFDILPIHIDRKGSWSLYDTSPLDLPQDAFNKNLPLCYRFDLVSPLPCDVIFSVLHGTWGEDGRVQGLFDLWGIPYVGSGVLGSAIGMNKIIAKQLVSYHQLASVVPYLSFNKKQWDLKSFYYQTQVDQIGYPVFVKPVSLGSSIGIQRVSQPSSLGLAIHEAFQYDSQVIIEKGLNTIREIEISVLEPLRDHQPTWVSAIGEIILRDDFYSYEAKSSTSTLATTNIPAILSDREKQHIERKAVLIFEALQLRDTARIDFLMDTSDNQLYFNEVNTLPGLTSTSMYPKLWEASGKPFKEVVTHLIQCAVNRKVQKYGSFSL